MATCKYSLQEVAKTIDHAVLKPEMTTEDVKTGCVLAKKYDVASICCKPCDVALCRDELAGSNVLVGTVIGFPHGNQATSVKVFETEQAILDGAVEIDLVINIGWMRSGHTEAIENEISKVVEAAAGNEVKVILENAYLTKEQIVEGCLLVERAGGHYAKTSTGFASTGAKLDDVKLMVEALKDLSRQVKVKSAGGIRTLDQLLEFMDAGVSRSGASTTAAILDEYIARYGI
jgi:deoxyribose-phosphate aldolase